MEGAVIAGSGAVSEAVGQIERELGALWSTPEGESPKVRASTMNYVVACGPTEVERARDAADRLAETRAGRVFILSIDAKRAPWEVDASASAVCHKDGSDVVCYDRIEISFGAMAAGRVASVIEALSLSEVPTFLEVGIGAPAPMVDALAGIADRVIVDSAHTSVGRIAELVKRPDVVVADRAFVRQFSWREFTARMFDADPDAARAIRSIEVAREPGKKTDPAALLIGWLAGRLGLRFEARDRAVDERGDDVKIAVVGPPCPGLEPGDIGGIRIVAQAEGGELRTSCQRTGETRTVEWVQAGARSVEHRYALGFRDETWVATKALESMEGDHLYRTSVLAAAEWSAA